METIKCDYMKGGTWGSMITLLDTEAYMKADLDKDTIDMYGWFSPKPSEGDTIAVEGEKYYTIFEVVSAKYPGDPADQFFAECKAVKQIDKNACKLDIKYKYSGQHLNDLKKLQEHLK